MRPCGLWLLLVADENGKLQDGDLSAGQQGRTQIKPGKVKRVIAGVALPKPSAYPQDFAISS
jgi:hypothetical protein